MPMLREDQKVLGGATQKLYELEKNLNAKTEVFTLLVRGYFTLFKSKK